MYKIGDIKRFDSDDEGVYVIYKDHTKKVLTVEEITWFYDHIPKGLVAWLDHAIDYAHVLYQKRTEPQETSMAFNEPTPNPNYPSVQF